MSFELQNLRKRLTDVEYEIAKKNNQMTFLQENLEVRQKQKMESDKHGWKWELSYQLGLEQTELAIQIEEAEIAKLINEIKFLRLMIQEKKEKLSSS